MGIKLTISVDFDGAIHSHRFGWQGGEILGRVVPGFFEWLESATRTFSIVIYSATPRTQQGVTEMRRWLTAKYKEWLQEQDRKDIPLSAHDVVFTNEKPAAWLSIDDRAIRFEGNWKDPELDIEAMRNFQSWKDAPKPPTKPFVQITQHPQNVTAVQGQPVEFSVVTEGIDTENLMYLWQFSNDGGSTYQNSVAAATHMHSNTYSVPVVGMSMNEWRYRVIIHNMTDGEKFDDYVVSNSAILTVTFAAQLEQKDEIIASAHISVVAPVVGIVPNWIATSEDIDPPYDIAFEDWDPDNPVFQNGEEYEVTVSLTVHAGFTFEEITEATINGQIAVIEENTGEYVTISYKFPAIVG